MGGRRAFEVCGDLESQGALAKAPPAAVSDHQTPVLTSRRDLSAVEVAYRMFERWRQENFFKYINADNVQRNVCYFCHCCGCCCNVLQGISRHGYTNTVVTSAYLAGSDREVCKGCGIRVRIMKDLILGPGPTRQPLSPARCWGTAVRGRGLPLGVSAADRKGLRRRRELLQALACRRRLGGAMNDSASRDALGIATSPRFGQGPP
jgi:hypothetical protein